jgi:hypothetical protein
MVGFVRLSWEVRHPRRTQGAESILVANKRLYRTIILGGASGLWIWVAARKRVAWAALEKGTVQGSLVRLV